MRHAVKFLITTVILVTLLFSCANPLVNQPVVETEAVEEETEVVSAVEQETGVVGIFIPAISPLIEQFYYYALGTQQASAGADRGVSPNVYIFSPMAAFTVTDQFGSVVDYWEYYSAGLELAEGNYTANRDIPIGRSYILTVEIFNSEVSETEPVVIGSEAFAVIGGTQSQVSVQLMPNPQSPAYTEGMAPHLVLPITLASAGFDPVEERITSVAAEWWFKIDTVPGQADPAAGKAIELSVNPTDEETIAFFAVFNDESDLVAVGSSEAAGEEIVTIFPLVADETYFVGVFPINDGSDSTLNVSYVVLENTPPTPYFEITPLVPEEGDTVTFDATGTTDPDGDPIANYAWDFESDGTVDIEGAAEQVVTHAYTSSQIYTVTLTVTDEEGSSSSIEELVIVDEQANRAPRAIISGEAVIDATQGDNVPFSAADSYDLDDGDTLTFSWDFNGDDAEDSADADTAYTFSEGAIYRVKLTATDQEGATDIDFQTVIVNAVPVASIASPADGAAFTNSSLVTLNGSNSSDSDGEIEDWMWQIFDWNSDPISTLWGIDTTFTFTEPGDYSIELIVTDDAGVDSVPTSIGVVVENRPPQAYAGENQYVTAENTAYLDGSYSTDPDGQMLTYDWYIEKIIDDVGTEVSEFFQDSTADAFETNQFMDPGTYEIFLEVTDESGATSNDNFYIIVPVPDPTPPTPEYNPPEEADPEIVEAFEAWEADQPEGAPGMGYFDPTEGIIFSLPGRPIAFDVSRSYDRDGLDPDEVLTYEWDFNFNGSTPEFDIPAEVSGIRSWQYDVPDSYVVYVQVTDSDEPPETAFFEIDVVILPPPNQAPVADAGPSQVVEVSFDPVTTITTTVDVEFDGTDSFDPDGGNLTYTWDFDDGSPVDSISGSNPVHTYDAAGIYLVELTVTDDGDPAKSHTDTMAVTVKRRTINYPPIADAGSSVASTVGEPFILDGSDSTDLDGQIDQFIWRLDGAVIASGSEYDVLDYMIDTAGTYEVILEVIDNKGLSTASDPIEIIISPPPPLAFVVNITYGGDKPFDRDHPLILALIDRQYVMTWRDRDPSLIQTIFQDGRYVMLISDLADYSEDARYALLVIHDLDGTGSPETNYWAFFDVDLAGGLSTDTGVYTVLEENGVLIDAGEPEYSMIFDDSNAGALDLTVQ